MNKNGRPDAIEYANMARFEAERLMNTRFAQERFECQECGRKFKSIKIAERAQEKGCPQCGSTDVDIET